MTLCKAIYIYGINQGYRKISEQRSRRSSLLFLSSPLPRRSTSRRRRTGFLLVRFLHFLNTTFLVTGNQSAIEDQTVVDKLTRTLPLDVPLAFISSCALASASFSIIPSNVLQRLCNSCGERLLKNQSKRKTGNSVISFLIRSYTSSACIP